MKHLIIGRVETSFFSIPDEHDLTKRFSKQGMKVWEAYFAPNLHNSSASVSPCEIPVSWFNFVTLMLMTPDKFDWAKGFLSSQLWSIIKESIAYEHTISFVIPDKCVTNQAPVCKLLEESQESPEHNLLISGSGSISPKRKRRDGGVPLVETEVRRSPRLVLLNDGYRNHDNCVDKNCLTCNVTPPLINTRVVKYFASSFCKVQEDGLEKRLLRKNKLESKKKAPGAAIEATAQGSKIAKGKAQANSSGSSKDKGTNATDGVASQAKKRPHK
jgi:hypothetical protein